MRLRTWLVFLSALLWASSASMVHAGNNVWTSNGPEGGDIRALALDPVTPTTLYAGTLGGVFKSTDGGSTWSAFNSVEYLSVPRTLAHHVTLLYRALLGRDPAEAEMPPWLNYLAGRLAEVEDFFINSPEFQAYLHSLFP